MIVTEKKQFNDASQFRFTARLLRSFYSIESNIQFMERNEIQSFSIYW